MSLFFTSTLWAVTPVVLDQQHPVFPLGPHFEIFEDTSQQMTLEDILSQPDIFHPPKNNIPVKGVTASAYWIRFSIQNPMDREYIWPLELDHSRIDDIQLYRPNNYILLFEKNIEYELPSSEQFTMTQYGDQQPFEQRDLKYRNFVFNLKIPAQSEVTYYMRFQSTSSVYLPLKLWNIVDFLEHRAEEKTMLSMYYAVMMIMLLYNVFLFIGTRDRMFLYYTLYLAAIVFVEWVRNGLAFQHFWPESTFLANHLWPGVLFPGLIASLQFTRSFLELPKHSPTMDRIFVWTMWAFLLAFFVSLFLPPRVSLLFCSTLFFAGIILITINSGIAMTWRYRPAYYYLLSGIVFVVGVILLFLKIIGIFPHIFLSSWASQVGSFVLAGTLALGVADRIKTITEEKEKVEAEAKGRLERTVEERTRDLNQTTVALEKSLQSLEHRNQVFQLLLETSASFPYKEKLDELFEYTLETFNQVLGELGFGLIMDGDRPEIVRCALFHDIPDAQQQIILKNNPKLLEINIKSLLKEHHISSDFAWHVLPMFAQKKEVIGKLVICGELDQKALEVVRLFLDQISAWSRTRILTEELEKMANTDGLTGTYNRGYFDRELERLMENSKRFPNMFFSCFMIDVNGLKRVNDLFGHESGDALIIQCAQLLKEATRKSDIVSRLGGDELVLLCPSTDESQAQRLLERIREKESQATMTCTRLDGVEETFPIRISIGVSSSENTPVEEVLKTADLRMYEDKKAYYADKERYR